MLVADGADRLARRRTPTPRPPTTVVDLDGALVTPAFVDAHVHATDTGLTLAGLDLSGDPLARPRCSTRSPRYSARPGPRTRSCSATAGTSRPGPAQTPPTPAELDRAGGGRHGLPVPGVASTPRSARPRCSPPTPEVVTTPGYDAVGLAAPRRPPRGPRRSRSARSRRRSGATRSVAALRTAAALGIAAVHECGGPGTSERGRLHRAARAGRRGQRAARGVRLLGRADGRGQGHASSARSAPAATCTPTARSARRPRTCASPTGRSRRRVRATAT